MVLFTLLASDYFTVRLSIRYTQSPFSQGVQISYASKNFKDPVKRMPKQGSGKTRILLFTNLDPVGPIER
jgi:hypothetical protein